MKAAVNLGQAQERSNVIKMATAGTRNIKPVAEANMAFGNRQSHQLLMKPICMCVLVCGNWESRRFSEELLNRLSVKGQLLEGFSLYRCTYICIYFPIISFHPDQPAKKTG